MDTAIEIKNLNKQYRDTVALDNVSLQINEGDIYGLIGRNGAGKSSLLRILCGQSTQYSGEIKFFGTKLEQDFDQRKNIGALIEYPAFYPELTGRQNLEYYRIQKGIPQKSSVDKVLENLDLVKLADRKFKHYSLGNKQRLGIALALLNNPKVLILDEPTNGLDPIGMKEIRKFLLDINKTYNTTILISSHILSELEHIITRIGFIDRGKMIKQISNDELRSICKRSVYFKVTNPNKVFSVIKSVLKNNEVTISEDSVIKITGENIDISEISKIILGENEQIQSVKESTDSLEDYFIQLVGGAHHE